MGGALFCGSLSGSVCRCVGFCGIQHSAFRYEQSCRSWAAGFLLQRSNKVSIL